MSIEPSDGAVSRLASERQKLRLVLGTRAVRQLRNKL
jgi:hypothetical protein